jgi:hypothetical protein
MKKKIRKIVVDGQEYAWNCNLHDDEGCPVRVIQIWKDKNNRIFREQCDDPHAKVTPSDIRKIINKLTVEDE